MERETFTVGRCRRSPNCEMRKMLELPSHIIDLIFSKLPIPILAICRLVCKAWNNLILSRQFDPISKPIFAYISPPHHYPNKLHCIDFDFDFDFDSKPFKEGKTCFVASFTFHPHFSTIEIINSCNGLLCFVDRSNNVLGGETMKACVFILNPMTNQYTQVPSHDYAHDYGGATDSYGYGFGFSPNTKQYKIVRLPRATMTPSAILFVADIFTFETSSYGKWTSVTIPSIYALTRDDGIYFNGGLYWRGYHFVVPRFHRRRFILRFDLENEKFEEIFLPQIEEQDFRSDDFGFQFFTGSLYASNFNDESCRFHVWKMEQDYSWTEEFIIPIRNRNMLIHFSIRRISKCNRFQLIKIFKDRKILCVDYTLDYLILYDSETKEMEALYHNLCDTTKQILWIYEIESFNFGSNALFL